MFARLGIAPIAWSNDDLPELGGDTLLETCLSDASEVGYTGVETGGKFPTTSKELGPILDHYKLDLCGGWYSGTLLTTDLEEEKDKVASQLELFRDLKAPCLVYGETAHTIQNLKTVPLNQKIRLDEDQIMNYGRKLTSFCAWCQGKGMPIAFHHHMGTAIETQNELDLLMNFTGEEVNLLFDPGHMAFSGGDNFAVIAKHVHRIRHVHTKDVRSNVLTKLNWARDSFLDAVLKGVFTVPGDGSLNFGEIVRRLADTGYEGWFVVEAEQDPAKAPPRQYALIGYQTLEPILRKEGYQLIRRNNE